MRNDAKFVRKHLLARVGKMRVYDARFGVLEAAHVLHLESPECQDVLGCLYDAVINGASGDLVDIAASRDLDDRPSVQIAADWYDYFRRCGCVEPAHVVLAAAYHAGMAAKREGVGV